METKTDNVVVEEMRGAVGAFRSSLVAVVRETRDEWLRTAELVTHLLVWSICGCRLLLYPRDLWLDRFTAGQVKESVDVLAYWCGVVIGVVAVVSLLWRHDVRLHAWFTVLLAVHGVVWHADYLVQLAVFSVLLALLTDEPKMRRVRGMSIAVLLSYFVFNHEVYNSAVVTCALVLSLGYVGGERLVRCVDQRGWYLSNNHLREAFPSLMVARGGVGDGKLRRAAYGFVPLTYGFVPGKYLQKYLFLSNFNANEAEFRRWAMLGDTAIKVAVALAAMQRQETVAWVSDVSKKVATRDYLASRIVDTKWAKSHLVEPSLGAPSRATCAELAEVLIGLWFYYDCNVGFRVGWFQELNRALGV